LKKLAKRFSQQIKQKNDQTEFLADPQAYLIGSKVQIGDVVEVAGFHEVLKYTNDTVLRNVYLQLVNHRGEKIGGSQAELDFVILGDVGVKEIVSAKLNPDRFLPNVDKANLRHYFAIPLHDSIQIIKYALANFGHVPKYNQIADVHVVYNEGGTISSIPLQTFRSQYLSQVAVDEIMVKSLTPEPETDTAASGDLTLKVTSRYLISRLAHEIKTAL
jgi:hypothetical protein